MSRLICAVYLFMTENAFLNHVIIDSYSGNDLFSVPGNSWWAKTHTHSKNCNNPKAAFQYISLTIVTSVLLVVFVSGQSFFRLKLKLWLLLLFYGPSTHFRSIRVRSVNLSTLFLGKPHRQFTSTWFKFFSPVTDNCPSWISRRERMAVEIISRPISMKECCRTWGSNPWASAYQADADPTQLPRPAQASSSLVQLH